MSSNLPFNNTFLGDISYFMRYYLPLVMPLLIVGFGIGFILWDRYIRRYIRINIVQDIDGKWFLIHSRKLGMKVASFLFKDKDGTKTYVINFQTALIDQRNRPILYYTLNNTNPIGFSIFEKTYKYNPTNLTRILRSHLVKEFLGTSKEKMYVIIILVLIVGVVAVAIFGQYQLDQLNNKLLQLLRDQIPPDIIRG